MTALSRLFASPAATGPSLHHHSQQSSETLRAESSEGTNMDNSRGPYARKFRGDTRNKWGNVDVASRLKEVLAVAYDGEDSKAKHAATDANSSPRAAENWFAGDNPMSLTAFLNAYHNNPAFKAWARKLLLLEQEHDPEFQAQLAAFIRAAQGVQT